MKLPWQDTKNVYGVISRLLHWSMALLLTWQFLGMCVKITVGRSAVTAFLVGTHRPVGLLLLALCLLRIFWGLCNAQRRPAYAVALAGRLARLGHIALYVLMFLVPSMALLRQIGSGKAFSFLGIPISQETGIESTWMTLPANWLHGLLAWCLLALIVGHIIMALAHHYHLKNDSLVRMLGRAPSQRQQPRS